jgi:biopolymer transport protein ExbB
MLINRVNAQESAGLGLAEAAGLTQGGEEAQFNFLQSFWDYFQADMISSIPITFASILVIAVMIERAFFYNRNNCDIAFLLNNLQSQLEKNDLEGARNIATQSRSITGEVAEEGIRLLAVQKEDFSKAYDITVNIVTRKLQQYLPVLGTVGAIAPFLGLFGTVSGVIKALWRMSLGGGGGSLEMVGEISNALIATGYGLAIAIVAVVFNNIFNNIVKIYEDDFLLLKLLFMSFMEVNFFETALASGSKTSGYSKNQYDNDDIDDSSYPDFLK